MDQKSNLKSFYTRFIFENPSVASKKAIFCRSVSLGIFMMLYNRALSIFAT